MRAAGPVTDHLVLDCRWLGFGGVGKATEFMLRGLSDGSPQLDWLAWGPTSTTEFAPEMAVVPTDSDPRSWAGQRSWNERPRGQLGIVYMHQTRPLGGPPCVTVIHDTTQIRTARTRATRSLRRAYLRRIARSSAGVITVSDWSRKSIERELGIPSDRIRVVGNPVDPAFGTRVRRLRESLPRREMALYVGSLGPHKNIPRLLAAFGESSFASEGGELVLAGASPHEAAKARRISSRFKLTVVERCPQSALDQLYAEARIVVQPSLEEGFGLPVWEAMSAGIPVCCSTGGALAEIGQASAAVFDPLSVSDIGRSLDSTVHAARALTPQDEAAAAVRFLAAKPTPAEYAGRMELAVLDLLRRHGT